MDDSQNSQNSGKGFHTPGKGMSRAALKRKRKSGALPEPSVSESNESIQESQQNKPEIPSKFQSQILKKDSIESYPLFLVKDFQDQPEDLPTIQNILKLDENGLENQYPNIAAMLLTKFISPLPRSQFYSDFWEVRPYHCGRNSPNYFGKFATKKQLELLLKRNMLAYGQDVDVITYNTDCEAIQHNNACCRNSSSSSSSPSKSSSSSSQQQQHLLFSHPKIEIPPNGDLSRLFSEGRSQFIFTRPQKHDDQHWKFLSLLEEEFQTVSNCHVVYLPPGLSITPTTDLSFLQKKGNKKDKQQQQLNQNQLKSSSSSILVSHCSVLHQGRVMPGCLTMDEAESFVLQCEGRSRWRLYRNHSLLSGDTGTSTNTPSTNHPLSSSTLKSGVGEDDEDDDDENEFAELLPPSNPLSSDSPSGWALDFGVDLNSPYLDVILNSGDSLYIPKYWKYRYDPIDTPSLPSSSSSDSSSSSSPPAPSSSDLSPCIFVKVHTSFSNHSMKDLLSLIVPAAIEQATARALASLHSISSTLHHSLSDSTTTTTSTNNNNTKSTSSRRKGRSPSSSSQEQEPEKTHPNHHQNHPYHSLSVPLDSDVALSLFTRSLPRPFLSRLGVANTESDDMIGGGGGEVGGEREGKEYKEENSDEEDGEEEEDDDDESNNEEEEETERDSRKKLMKIKGSKQPPPSSSASSSSSSTISKHKTKKDESTDEENEEEEEGNKVDKGEESEDDNDGEDAERQQLLYQQAQEASLSLAHPDRTRLLEAVRLSLQRVVGEGLSVVDSAADQLAKSFILSRLPMPLTPTQESRSISSLPVQCIAPYTRVRLLRPGIARLVMEDGMVVLYHCLDNPRDGLSLYSSDELINEEEEKDISSTRKLILPPEPASPPPPLEFDVDDGPTIEMLLRAYPHSILVSDLYHCSEEIEDKVGVTQSLFKEGLLVVEDEMTLMVSSTSSSSSSSASSLSSSSPFPSSAIKKQNKPSTPSSNKNNNNTTTTPTTSTSTPSSKLEKKKTTPSSSSPSNNNNKQQPNINEKEKSINNNKGKMKNKNEQTTTTSTTPSTTNSSSSIPPQNKNKTNNKKKHNNSLLISKPYQQKMRKNEENNNEEDDDSPF